MGRPRVPVCSPPPRGGCACNSAERAAPTSGLPMQMRDTTWRTYVCGGAAVAAGYKRYRRGLFRPYTSCTAGDAILSPAHSLLSPRDHFFRSRVSFTRFRLSPPPPGPVQPAAAAASDRTDVRRSIRVARVAYGLLRSQGTWSSRRVAAILTTTGAGTPISR